MSDTLRIIPITCGATAVGMILAISGCEGRDRMVDRGRAGPLDASTVFPDGALARPRVAGTIPRPGPAGRSLDDAAARRARPPISFPLVQRGRERFDIFCAPCHGRDGYGRGMVIQRGFPQAASHHSERLRDVDDAYLFTVITEGTGNMPAHGALVPIDDRWAIVAYLRALQRSQRATFDDVPPGERARLLAKDSGTEPSTGDR